MGSKKTTTKKSSTKKSASSRPRPPCTVCHRVHSSEESAAACRAAHSKRSRSKSKTHTSHRTHPTTVRSPTTSHSRSKDPESGRHPSSSLGPGLAADPVMCALLVILALTVIILFIIGVWLLAARDGWPVGLNLSGSRRWTRTISYGTACVIVSLLLLLVLVFASLAATTRAGAVARINRLTTVFLASIAFIILVLMTFNALFFASNGPEFISTIIREGWENTVEDDNTVEDACRIQRKYKCEGWEDNSCIGCRPSVNGFFGACTEPQIRVCPKCWSEPTTTVPTAAPTTAPVRPLDASFQLHRDSHVARQAGTAPVPPQQQPPQQQPPQQQQPPGIAGCRRFVLRRYREFFIPMSVYTIFLALVLILLSWKTCIDSSGR